MNTSAAQALAADLADAIHGAAQRAGTDTPAVRGSDWRLATVSSVGSDGTVATSDGITARRMDTYVAPAVSDLIVITQASNGNWLAWGRSSTGTVGIGETLFARKTGSTARASTITVTSDPHLTLTVSPGTYAIDCFIVYAGDATNELRLGWTVPASTTGAWWPDAPDTSAVGFAASPRWGAVTDVGTSTQSVGATGTGNTFGCRVIGTAIVTTAGTFALAWAQSVSGATATTLFANSHLMLRRVA